MINMRQRIWKILEKCEKRICGLSIKEQAKIIYKSRHKKNKKVTMNRKELIELLKQMHGEYLVWKAKKIISGEYYKDDSLEKNSLKDKFYGRYADKILRKLK